MTCVHVVTDGTAALPNGASDDYGIVVVGGSLLVGDAEFGLPCSDLTRLLQETDRSAVAPHLRPAGSSEFRLRYQEVLGWGVEIVSLHAPEAVGGAAAAARLAASEIGAGAPISVVGIQTTSVGLGLIAARLAALGLDQQPRGDLVRLAALMADSISLFAVGESPAAASRAGLTGGNAPAVALESGADEARPLLELSAGQWRVVEWLADTGAGLMALAERVTSAAEAEAGGLHVGVMTAAADAEAAALATFLESRAFPSELWIAPADAPTAAILGTGGFGVAWYADGA